MNLPRLAIRRPVATIVIVGLFVLIGLVSFGNVPLDLLPNINVPVAVVLTQYSGAGPEEVEQLVSIPLEEALSTVTGIQSIESRNIEGTSVVIAQFDWGTNMDSATLDIRDKVDRVKGYLPDDTDEPMVLQIDPAAMNTLQLSVSGGHGMAELKTLVDESIVPGLERLDGVASVDVQGGRDRQVELSIDVDKLKAHGLSILQVVQALQLENLNLPAGSVGQAEKQYVVRVLGEYKSLDDIRNVSIATPFGGRVRIAELGEVSESLQDPTSLARLNGRPTLGLSIQKESSANTVQVVSDTLQRLNELKEQLPGDLEIGVASNPAEFIQHSLQNVSQSAAVGGLLAVVILYLFLASFRTTAIVAVAIPISIVSTFSLLYFYHLTLNMISLGGLALGIGMLVDNAIVVVESIHRHSRNGSPPREAAAVGAQEVAMAITASTLTSMAVFLPIAFIQGLAAEIFRQLALTVSFSLLASLFVALTLIPLLASRFLGEAKNSDAGPATAEAAGVEDEEGNDSETTERLTFFQRWFEALERAYRRFLQWSLDHRLVVVVVALVLFASAVGLISAVGTEFLPSMDTGEFTVSVELPRGASLETTDEATARVEEVVLAIPELKSAFTTVGSSSATALLSSGGEADRAVILGQLVSRGDRSRSTDEVVEDLRDSLAAVPGVQTKVTNESFLGMGGSLLGEAPVIVRISGDDFDLLRSLADQIGSRMGRVAGLREITSSVEEGKPELHVELDRQAAAHYGLNTAQVAQTVRAVVNGMTATRYNAGSESIDVVVRGEPADRQDVDELCGLVLLTPTGAQVTLGSVADISIVEGPVAIERSGQVRVIEVTADLVGRSLGDAMNDIKSTVGDLALPPGYNIEYTGEYEQMMDAFSSLYVAFIMAAILVYGVLAVQFESLLHPFTIMLSIPLAIVGVVLGLLVTGRTLNISAYIGVIMLAGIVVNNAIVLLDYTNQLRRRGIERRDAVLTAGVVRLRPILMTALTTVLAMLPMVFALQEGTEIEAPLATVVVFGLSFATLLTLVFIPVMYTLLEDLVASIRARLLPAGPSPREVGTDD